MSYVYLAGPYTHEDPAVRHKRAELLTELCASMNREGTITYSPITHGHDMAMRFGLPKEIDFWERHCCALLKPASKLVVYRLEGWLQSDGIRMEIAFANKNGIPIEYAD